MQQIQSKIAAFWRTSARHKLIAVGVALVIIIAGLMLTLTKASGFFAAVESEQGSLTTNAKVVADSGASGGKAVQFTPPAPSGGGPGGDNGDNNEPPGGGTGGTCAVSTPHVPDGPDGAGGCWPGPSTTGVPSGVTLSTYTGPCTITTSNTVIDSKIINCSPLVIRAKAVVVKRSKVNGQIFINSDDPATQYNLNFSLILQDSEVAAPLVEEPAVFEGAMTITRSNIHGGITSVQCGDKSAQCIIQDSWLHGQLMPNNVDWHLGGFHSIGGTGYEFTHNAIVCDTPVNNVGGGCSGDIVFIPYDKPISHATVQHNLLGANRDGSYCLYAGDKLEFSATYMVFKDNVFQRGANGKCGTFGPVSGYGSGNTGNQWINNKWQDGAVVSPT